MFSSFVARRPKTIAASPGSQGGWGYSDLARDRRDRQELFHEVIVAVSERSHHLKHAQPSGFK
jgi:hypothetical protein